MLIRRCAHLSIEAGEALTLDLADLLSGGIGVRAESAWVARVPGKSEGLPLTIAGIDLLGRVGDEIWIERDRLAALASVELIDSLLESGLLISDDPAHAMQRAADSALRRTAWFPASAQLHTRSRWQGVDSRRDDPRRNGSVSLEQLVALHGPIPAHFHARSEASARLPLPQVATGTIEDLLGKRTTCRNFDLAQPLPLPLLARALKAVFGAQGTRQLATDSFAVKKLSPSGGALHPIEAYMIVQRVDGLAPGRYHYHVGDHALEPMGELAPAPARELAMLSVAGQEWFADAPVQIVLAARFQRNFWKYRNHAKAYRVIQLDAGHLSQNMFLIAAELGLGAFVTGAINEIDIEHAFGLDGMSEGPICVVGLGHRAAEQVTVEFDPQGRVWAR
jgi:putative peptide maturation dehydrogenase